MLIAGIILIVLGIGSIMVSKSVSTTLIGGLLFMAGITLVIMPMAVSQ